MSYDKQTQQWWWHLINYSTEFAKMLIFNSNFCDKKPPPHPTQIVPSPQPSTITPLFKIYWVSHKRKHIALPTMHFFNLRILPFIMYYIHLHLSNDITNYFTEWTILLVTYILAYITHKKICHWNILWCYCTEVVEWSKASHWSCSVGY